MIRMMTFFSFLIGIGCIMKSMKTFISVEILAEDIISEGQFRLVFFLQL